MGTSQQFHVEAVRGRDLKYLGTDQSALNALIQAAINVELFTIPLYMVTLYSIQGMHEINASGQTFYKGRLWPGAATCADPKTANEHAFNNIFSVFIQEMLHLQLASNLAAIVGVKPTFTSPVLQTENFGWRCYGPEKTVIPHIIDLEDTIPYKNVKVALGPLDAERIELLLAIEEPEELARRRIEPSKLAKYFPRVPFADWNPNKTEVDLPMFGTIGYMYECLVGYFGIEYSDGSTLWSHVFDSTGLQRDLFNTPSGTHPMPEYPGFPTVVASTNARDALTAAIDIVNAITDQGEGDNVSPALAQKLTGKRLNLRVEQEYRSSQKALELDYPSYDASGEPARSADATARFRNDGRDHYDRFLEVKNDFLADVVTWDKWHEKHGPWTEQDLLKGPDQASPKIPKPTAIKDALNRLKAKDKNGSVFDQLSRVAAGSIAGVTSVLDSFFNNPSAGFPFPAMGGTADRVAMCWAVLGKAPDLSRGTERAGKGKLYHACQGLDFEHPGGDEMPAVATYHTCIGSNNCKGQGGCGFVHGVTNGGGSCSSGGGSCGSGGGSCGVKIGAKVLCGGGGGTPYSAPADNQCGSLGGCAVPISASQLYPKSGEMWLYDVRTEPPRKVGSIPFERGDVVYDIAWQAYCEVLKSTSVTPPSAPPPADDLRLAFPPST
jgi:hypothetical protein